MTSAEPKFATGPQRSTERSIEAWRTGTSTFADQLDRVTIPVIDLTEPIATYFEYVQRAVDVNPDLAVKQAEKAEQIAKKQTRPARTAERERTVKDHERELTDRLAERGLPKTGTVEELIERLVSGDSE